MLEQIEEKNRQVWEGHNRMFEDVTHVLGGLGLGLLAYSAFGGRARSVGLAMLGISAMFHFYAFATSQAAVEAPPARLRRVA